MIPYVMLDQSITIYIDGEPRSVPRDWDKIDALISALKDEDAAAVRRLVAGYKSAQAAVNRLAGPNLPRIVVTRRSVTLDGEPVHSALARRMIDIANTGLPLDPWVKFMQNLYLNPAEYARDELYQWLEESDLPITDDGHFLAYKKVRDNFRDIHSGQFDNSPGKVVTMPGGRPAVDTDRHNTCSTGLHFCSRGYLPHFGGYGGGNVVVLVKINPADVVSIPSDYNNQKGRTWRYEVIQQVNLDGAVWDDAPVVFTPKDDESGDWFSFDPEGNPIPRRATLTPLADGSVSAVFDEEEDDDEYDEDDYWEDEDDEY